MLSVVMAVAVAQPFVRTMATADEHGPCLWWEGPVLDFRQSSGGLPSVGAQASLAAVSAAFSSWNDAMQCSMLNVFEGPRVTTRRTGATATGANTNLVLFRHRACSRVAPSNHACWREGTCNNTFDCWDQPSSLLGTTTVSFDAETGRIFDADIELNGADHVFSVVDSPVCEPGAVSPRCVANDIQNTATHEVGHFLGLGHTSATNSTMNETSPMGERRKRSVDTGTRSFLCAAYSPDFGPDDCVTPPVAEALGPAATAGCASLPAGPLLMLALLVLLKRRRTAGLAASLLVAPLAHASTVRQLSLDALVEGADTIARVKVTAVHARWTPDGARIVTDVTLSVLEGWKGPGRRELLVIVPGGVVGRVGQRIEGAPRFAVGQELVVLLEARGDVFVPHGWSQGLFEVSSRGAGEPLVTQQRSEAWQLSWSGTPAPTERLTLPLSALRRLVLSRAGLQGADSNRAGPFALPTQMSR
ncbi:MAG: myxosortase-dependent metalloprotease, MXAN_2677/MXAN_2678 family [Myxococcaceae bacterium]|nr:myxosortase-dependent metalloprotease, MXAN_2677/MXAN_2678 family [Myxococcaceae bacterium]